MMNISIFAIPVQWALCMVPHGYAISVILKANNGKWDNTNPRSLAWDETLRRSVSADVYARYQRSEAAHKNGMENLPMFIGAVLAGNLADLGSQTLNNFVVGYICVRAVYAVMYINTSKHKTSLWRSVVWYLTAILFVRIFVLAGLALANREW